MTLPPRKSRKFWPDALTTAGVGEGHTHMVSPRYKRMFMLAMVLFIFLTLSVGAIWYRVLISGTYRDQQVDQIREEVRRGHCELLDTFPEDVQSLERAREQNHCGPGIPIGMLTPEERAEFEEYRNPVRQPAKYKTETDPMGGAVVEPRRAPVNEPPSD